MGNITSRHKSAKANKSSERFSQYLKPLSPEEIYSTVAKHLEDDPTKRAKFILMNDTTFGKPIIPLTKRDMDLIVSDCLHQIGHGMSDEVYILAVAEGIANQVHRTRNPAVEVIREAMEQLLSLVSMSIKGEACTKCAVEDQNPDRFSFHTEDDIYDMLEDIESIAKDQNVQLSLSPLADFGLNKLCSIYPHYRHLKISQRPYILAHEDIEEMWCESGVVSQGMNGRRVYCKCWEWRGGMGDDVGHGLSCPMHVDYSYEDSCYSLSQID